MKEFLPRDAMLVRYMLLCVLPSVRLSVRLSHVGIIPKWLKVRSREQHRTTAQRHQVSEAKNVDEIMTRSPQTGTLNRGVVGSDRRFSTNISLYLKNCAR